MEDIGKLWVPTEFEVKHRGYIARVWHFNGEWRWGIGPDIPEGFVPLVESGETFASSESARSDAEKKLQDPESLIRAQNYDSINDSDMAMLDRATKNAGEAMKWNVVVHYKDGRNHIEGVLREDLMATWKASINHPLNDKRVVRIERFPSESAPREVKIFTVLLELKGSATDDECKQMVLRFIAGQWLGVPAYFSSSVESKGLLHES